YMRYQQKCFAETESINRMVFETLKKETDSDTVIFAGDLTFNGERESHELFREMLYDLKNSGKRVYVVTADHDCHEDAFAFDGNGRREIGTMPREELFDFYADFGFGSAIAADRQHLSYVAQLAPGIRMLGLNNDGASDGKRRFDEEHRAWIAEQLCKAKEDGEMIFAVNHYPILPGKAIFGLIGSAVQKESDKAVRLLADGGCHLVFTGHMHNQAINGVTTEAGNRFVDVCTGSAIADPSVYRFVTLLSPEKADVKTRRFGEFEFKGEMRGEQYLKDMFDNMILNLIADMKTDPQRLLNKFGIGDKQALKPVFRFLGKRFDKMTLAGACRTLLISCPESIRKLPLKIFISDVVREMFEGNPSYGPDSDRGKVFAAMLKKLNFALKKVKVKNPDGSPGELRDVLLRSAGPDGYDDWNAVVDL
ncbi:MAG: metallophosphoesterase, partial [Clostridia bacterium]|nr:metallophosphoesterase [Clostridia bacterium]